VIGYDNDNDVATLEFDVESGVEYEYNVKKEVKANRLKLAKDTQKKIDDYEDIFQIGAVVEVRWSKDDIVETDLLHGKRTFSHRMVYASYLSTSPKCFSVGS
jgi:hypothetical protein